MPYGACAKDLSVVLQLFWLLQDRLLCLELWVCSLLQLCPECLVLACDLRHVCWAFKYAASAPGGIHFAPEAAKLDTLELRASEKLWLSADCMFAAKVC